MKALVKYVLKTIERLSMLEQGDHVLVAVSGGPDSVALLKVLTLLSSKYRLRLTVAHLNHGLRGGEADNEEDFVRRLSQEMGIGFVSRKVDIRTLKKGKGRSLEEIGREERYRFLEEAAKSCKAVKIATGHHSGDQAETVILNLIRGSGLDGLKGIPPVRDRRIIRPLINVTKNDIHTFLHEEGLSFITDSSNMEPIFLRNRIRHILLPDLTLHYNPRIENALCKMAEIIRREDDYLQSVVQQILIKWDISPDDPEMSLPLAELTDLHDALRARIIKYLLESFTQSKLLIGYRHVESVLNLCHISSQRRASLDLPGRICVEKDMNELRIKKMPDKQDRITGRKDQLKPSGFSYTITVPGVVSLPKMGKNIYFDFVKNPGLAKIKHCLQIAYLDYEKISPPLILRTHHPGDRIEPFGMMGTKKLHDYFIDRKIPFSSRAEIPLLVDTESVIWIAGQTISERVKVSSQTKKVLKAEMV